MALPRPPHHSVEEYLARERESVTRHEYLDGQIYDMAGGRLQHSRIFIKLAVEIGSQLRGRECEALSPNMKVKAGDSGLFAYPDLSVVCGKPVFLDSHRDVLLNPVVIFEVLSPTTEGYDRGEKFFRYRNFINTLADYLVVSQHRPLVENFVRQDDGGQWLYVPVEGLSSKLHIRSIGCLVELSEIYARVDFSQAAPPATQEP